MTYWFYPAALDMWWGCCGGLQGHSLSLPAASQLLRLRPQRIHWPDSQSVGRKCSWKAAAAAAAAAAASAALPLLTPQTDFTAGISVSHLPIIRLSEQDLDARALREPASAVGRAAAPLLLVCCADGDACHCLTIV